MPELPELEIIAIRLTENFGDKVIQNVAVYNHLVIHGIEALEFEAGIIGKKLNSVKADGKFLLFNLSGGVKIVVNPMLAGRFWVYNAGRAPGKTDIFSLQMESTVLWYRDRKQMSRVYLIRGNDFSDVAGFEGRGPSPLDSELTLKEFTLRLKRRRGQIKNVLRNQSFVKGIGNAYADEILLYAGIHPFRRRSTLSEVEVESLYQSMKKVLAKYLDLMTQRELSEFSSEKRNFLMIHGKGGGVCPLCGGRISEVRANRFKTNYCQTCQI
ncbi:MAG: hypothetical protein JSW61_05230 [Candidatus Thorarchaeota archaeon]|nr:MAG: hypothetical protein JSW61_05230 [Candidatus Thorarchaeota archaeon]